MNSGITLLEFVVPVLPLSSYVILGKLLNLSVPLFSYLWNGVNNATYMWKLSWRSKELIQNDLKYKCYKLTKTVKLFTFILYFFSFVNSFSIYGKHMEQCWKHSKCLLLSSHALMPGKLYFTFFYAENKRPGNASLANVKALLYFYKSQDSLQWEWTCTRNISTRQHLWLKFTH